MRNLVSAVNEIRFDALDYYINLLIKSNEEIIIADNLRALKINVNDSIDVLIQLLSCNT